MQPATTRRGTWFSCSCCWSPSCSGTDAALISKCFMCTLLYFVSARTGMWSMEFTRLSYCSCRSTSPWEVCTLINECRFQSGLFCDLGSSLVRAVTEILAHSRWQRLDSQLRQEVQVLLENYPFRNDQLVPVHPTALKNMSILSDHFNQTQNKT